MQARVAISRSAVVDQLRALGVEAGRVLLVHTSFRATGPIEGGPRGLIEALREAIGPDGTLVMLSYPDDDDVPFDPLATPAAADLGIVAEMFWRLPNTVRTQHPIAFTAAGPRAEEVTAGRLPLPPHGLESPVGRVYALDGQVLLLGVGHAANTTLHLAEAMANAPYGVPKHCTLLEDGQARRIEYLENDHCCERFALADGWLRERGQQREGLVGHGQARLMRARDVVAVALEHLGREPLLFLHEPRVACEECDAARASVR